MDFDVITPKTKNELLETIAENQQKHYRFGAGCTDLLMELKRQPEENLTVINLAQMHDDDFISINISGEEMRIGSLATAAEILKNPEIKKMFPVLHESAYNLASMQIRETATIGGNICTASPSGDMACALMALQAKCEILNTNGDLRSVPMVGFFTGVRQTVLQKDEVLQSITIPLNSFNTIQSGFIKIGTRLSMECSVVSLAYHIQKDESGKIQQAGIAIGSVAPTIKFTDKACDFLIGKTGLNEIEREEFAGKVMKYASPISDIRATDWYRKEVLFNICKGIFE
jgi:xanthine dehydrogenase FAD-binding subunit